MAQDFQAIHIWQGEVQNQCRKLLGFQGGHDATTPLQPVNRIALSA
ncbi:Uncharacterised protein [Vibrio cholerae]|nr:Uncharacterised protein [Vibrio cholerae]